MQIHTYTAEPRIRDLPTVLASMLQGLRVSPYIAYRLARASITAQYAKSVFGFAWDFADPLVLGGIFYLLRRSNVFTTGETNMPYSIYLIYGLLLYQTFVSATMLTVDIIPASRGLLTQQKLPPEALLLSVFLRVTFFSFFRIAVMLIFSLVAGAFSLPGFGLFLVGFPMLIAAGMSIGLFFAPFNAIYRDTGRFVGMVMVPLRFISPVFFVLPDTAFYRTLTALNPFALISSNLRLLATNNLTANFGLTAIHCMALLVLGLLGWFVFHISIPVLAERA